MRICEKISPRKSKQVRQAIDDSTAEDSKQVHARVEFSGIVDHNSALLALAGAAVEADCDPCLDRIAPELEGVGMSKTDIRNAVKSRRFPGAFPKLELHGGESPP